MRPCTGGPNASELFSAVVQAHPPLDDTDQASLHSTAAFFCSEQSIHLRIIGVQFKDEPYGAISITSHICIFTRCLVDCEIHALVRTVKADFSSN